eukprot:Gb_28941 [translate_table: standard]
MPPKEQPMVDDGAIRRERRDPVKQQEIAKVAQRKGKKSASKKGESLINSRPGNSMAQRETTNKVELVPQKLIPALDKDENDIRVEVLEEDEATNSPMTLTAWGKTCSTLNEKDGEDPLDTHN